MPLTPRIISIRYVWLLFCILDNLLDFEHRNVPLKQSYLYKAISLATSTDVLCNYEVKTADVMQSDEKWACDEDLARSSFLRIYVLSHKRNHPSAYCRTR